jgi:hypothetical protein
MVMGASSCQMCGWGLGPGRLSCASEPSDSRRAYVTVAPEPAKSRSRRARIRAGTVGSAYVQGDFASIQGIATAMNITTNSGDGQRSHQRSCVEKLR